MTQRVAQTDPILATELTLASCDAWLSVLFAKVSAMVLPTDVATETTLALIKAKTDNIPPLGQALASASVPVILPSATITTLTPPAAITNFANETGGNLAAIKAKTDNLPPLGQALAAASVPVILPAATITTLTPPAALTNYANETGGNLASIKGKTDNLDILLSALRDAIVKTGSTSKTLADICTLLAGGLPASLASGKLDAAATLAAETTKVIGTVNQGTSPWTVLDTHGKTIKFKSGTAASSGDNTILSAVSSKSLTVFACKVVAVTTTALTAKWTDGASGTEMWSHLIQTPANVVGGDNLAVTPPGYLFQGSSNTALILNLSSAISVRYTLSYWEN